MSSPCCSVVSPHSLFPPASQARPRWRSRRPPGYVVCFGTDRQELAAGPDSCPVGGDPSRPKRNTKAGWFNPADHGTQASGRWQNCCASPKPLSSGRLRWMCGGQASPKSALRKTAAASTTRKSRSPDAAAANCAPETKWRLNYMLRARSSRQELQVNGDISSFVAALYHRSGGPSGCAVLAELSSTTSAILLRGVY